MRRPALSPSRASDFEQCPLLYRFRAIDRLPEPQSTAQVRGSVVHAALEQLYALPAAQRGRDTAMALVGPAWDRVIAAQPDLAADIEPALRAELLDEARALLSGYYRLEDPTLFDPQSCEQRVEVELDDGTLLRGFVDRIDVAPTGELRVVDYKTGKAPPEARALAEFKAMFQMKFYAVALFRSRGVLPARLRLLYLSDGQVLDGTPDLDELLRFEKTLIAIWRAIQAAGATGDLGLTRHGCATGAPTMRTARCSAALPRRTPVGRRLPTRAAATRCCTPRSRLRDRLPLPAACRRRRIPGVRVHRRHAQQLGSRNPARFTPVGADDKGHRGAGAGFRDARRTGDPRHPRRHPGHPAAAASVGGASRGPDLVDGRRDAGAEAHGGERAVARATAWLLATSDTADEVTDRYAPLVEGDSVAVPHSWEGAPGISADRQLAQAAECRRRLRW